MSAPCGRQRGKWGDRRSIYPSVCLYVCFDRLSYLRSKLRNGVGDGADAVASTCVCVFVCVCVCACVCMCVCVCQLVPAQVKGFNSFPNWMRGADTAQSDLGLASRTVGTEVIYPEGDSHADAFRFLSWNLDNSGSALLHNPN